MQKVDGLGDVAANIQIQQVQHLDGGKYLDCTLQERSISVEFLIVADPSAGYDEVTTPRSKISRVLNPRLGLGKLRYENDSVVKEIEAVADSVPVFPDVLRTEVMQKGLVSFVCPDPYWRDIADTKTEIALWEPRFEFPLELTAEGSEMGVRSPSLIVNVLNTGHVETGMIIKFRATGTVVNPALVNVNTAEYFKINRTLTAGETITINTNRGKKRIESTLNGVTTNIFNNIVFGSTFLQLDIGDNLFRYSADEHIEALEADIYHSPLFVGV